MASLEFVETIPIRRRRLFYTSISYIFSVLSIFSLWYLHNDLEATKIETFLHCSSIYLSVHTKLLFIFDQMKIKQREIDFS